MKKLMIGLAVAGLCGAVFADVQSANVVGYANNGSAGRRYVAYGPSFIDVGNAEGKFTFGKCMMAPGEGYDRTSDLLYLVNPDTCEADSTIVYRSGKWRDSLNGNADMTDVELSIGTGFQSDYYDNFAITTSGEVHGDGYSVDCTGKRYQFVVNGTGRDITWKEITINEDKYDRTSDLIYVVNPETCEADSTVVFRSGKWRDSLNGNKDMSDEIIKAGEGFQTDFYDDIVINFPPAFETAE